MADPIGILTHEHRIIEEVLGALETFIENLGVREEHERSDVAAFARFFQEFVDRCHHGKEENYLFVRMNAYGFSREHGPVSAMLSEQGEGREHLLALAAIGAGAGPLSRREQADVRGHALGYVMRIRPHVMREEDILFPMVLHALPDFVLDELGRDFEAFDRSFLPTGFHEELRRLSTRLIASYSPKRDDFRRTKKDTQAPL